MGEVLRRKWLGFISTVALLLISVLAFQNCSPGFESLDSANLSSESSSGTDLGSTPSPSAGVNKIGTPATVQVTHNGKGLCNAVSFSQVPTDLNYFVGRVMNESSPGACDSTSWSLALFKMNWATNTLELQKFVFQPDALDSTGKKIESSYDPHVVQFNNELWLAFECAGRFGIGASSCIAPFTIENGVDKSRMNVVVQGSWKNGNTEAYSASVPKLLVFKGELYIYWTTCHFELRSDGYLLTVEVLSLGAKLKQETSGLKRMWVENSPGVALAAWDTSKSSEVWGATSNDSTANSMADIFDFYVKGDTIYAVAAVGSVGCVTPLSPLFGCYRTRIASSKTPLGHHVFNNDFVNSPALPANPMEYTRFFKNLDGSHFMMGQYAEPTLNGTVKPATMIAGGYQRYSVDLNNMKTVPTGTSEGMEVRPVVERTRVEVNFTILQIFQRGCLSTASTSVACSSAASRFCQTQGFLSSTGVLQHTGDKTIVACLSKNAATSVAVTIAELKALNSSCTQVATATAACQSAVFHYCQNNGFKGGGFGPQEANGNNISITCLPEGRGSAIGTTFAALSGYGSACSSAVPAGDSCRAAADLMCRAQGYAAGYGIVDHSGAQAALGCVL